MRRKITTIKELREAIRDLEHQNYVNEQHMRDRVAELADRFRLANVIKRLISHFFKGRSERKTNLLKLAAGVATSFIVRRFFKKGIAAR